MKKIYFLLLTILISSSSFGQIWTEDFSTYTDGTGIDGSVGNTVTNIGDYPAGVSQWTLDASGAALTASSDWAKTISGIFSFRDIDGPLQWNSEMIDISGAPSAVSFSLDASNNAGGFETSDFYDVYYSVDGGAFTLIPDWNGLGDSMHTIIGEKGGVDWSTTETISVTGISGNTLQIRVETINNSGNEQFFLDNIIVSSGALPPSITLTSPSNGTAFNPGTTSVNVEWTTANLVGGETVDITVNGTTTNNVTSPFPIATMDGGLYNVTLELVNGGPLDTDMTSFSVNSLTQVANIAALRAATIGNVYELTGEALLTYQQGFRNQKFIEDATAGILIDDSAGNITTTYAIGDGITGIVGTLNTFGGMMQFTPAQDSGVASSTGNVLTPQSITVAMLAANPEDYESELVQVTAVNMDNTTPTFAGGSEHAFTQGMDTFNFRSTFFSADYVTQSGQVPTVTTDITGIVNERNGSLYFLTARDVNDFSATITLSTNDFETSNFSIYPNPTNTGFVNIKTTSNEAVNVAVYNILGKQVIAQEVNNNTLNVSNLNSGVYLLKLTQNGASTTKKLVIE